MDKERAIEIALVYIPTMLGDEADLGITYKDLEEVPNVLEAMLNDYEQGRVDAIDDFVKEMRKYWGGLKAMEEIEHVADQLKEQRNE